MAEDSTSQTQKAVHFVNKMLFGQVDRMEAWQKQVGEWQEKGYKQAERTIEESADLAKATMKYQQDVTQNMVDLQKQMLEQATSFFNTEET